MEKKIQDEIPLWFRSDGKLKNWVSLKDYKPMVKSHFEVMIKLEEPEHSGYCSDYDSDCYEDITYHSKILYKNFPVDTWEMKDFLNERCFSFTNGCRKGKSSYCLVKTKVSILSIKKV